MPSSREAGRDGGEHVAGQDLVGGPGRKCREAPPYAEGRRRGNRGHGGDDGTGMNVTVSRGDATPERECGPGEHQRRHPGDPRDRHDQRGPGRDRPHPQVPLALDETPRQRLVTAHGGPHRRLQTVRAAVLYVTNLDGVPPAIKVHVPTHLEHAVHATAGNHRDAVNVQPGSVV